MDKDTILHVAKLANLKLADEEVEKYRLQLSPILDYIAKLNEVDTGGVEPTIHPILDMKNRFQEGGMDNSLDINEVIKNAKEKDGNYIVTGAVL